MQVAWPCNGLWWYLQVMVLMQLLKAIRTQESSDKVVLVSNYTEALDILGKVAGENFRELLDKLWVTIM